MSSFILKQILIAVLALLLTIVSVSAGNDDYKKSKEYQTLRDSVFHSFNDGDSARFYVAVKMYQDYLLEQDDLHAYYTQRCNEIVFELNRQHVFEAYKLARQLSKELAERKLDKEMYMAYNMMGHIYSYSGNKESAKRCFWEVIHRMEKEGYTESIPPIYMNLVNIYIDEDPEEALRLIDKAESIASGISPERVFDIETRRTLAYYLMGDQKRFLEGYKAYREGVEKGLSSVHGRKLEVYYLAQQGKTDEAIRLATESDDDPYETQAELYSKAGQWENAFHALECARKENDSINSVILSTSMQGIQQELRNIELQRQADRRRTYLIAAVAGMLLLLVIALSYIILSRRRHIRQMKAAYQRILESDKMKMAFIQNVSHEVRTPLNIISGFAQVIADSDYEITQEERQHISGMVMTNTRVITTMINEVLEMSNVDAIVIDKTKSTNCNGALHNIISHFCKDFNISDNMVRLETTLADDMTISLEELTLQRILFPLLDNAVKNGGDQPIKVKAWNENGRLMLTVEDRGCGIPAEEAEHIFERFVKLDTFKNGLGLGLTYSRTVARRAGGDVNLDTSYPGPGARFKVMI